MTIPRSLKSKLLVGATVVTAGAAFIMPTAAFAGTNDDLPVRLERACLRIPNLEIRANKLISRLEGDASVRGSLAWLQARIDDAKAKGRTQLATVLENRLKVRTQTVEVVKARIERLENLAEKCRAHGVDI
ncbi:MAG TPA: hypothetical protein VLD86_08055 [Ilumatobacteraceae bacterium]|nr:hypothetical protein [Ilumatobacteraceae bacterium]